MRHTPLTGPRPVRSFGRAPLGRLEIASRTRRRLRDKIDSLEREAKRLSLRGEKDAATALERAAARTRLLLREDIGETGT
ncbi:MAG: hypothetical protein GC153_01175 [Alphaproteobacteria bacterium]|nr:hypothetical protein [Alphaproteobacteria bacterium]